MSLVSHAEYQVDKLSTSRSTFGRFACKELPKVRRARHELARFACEELHFNYFLIPSARL